MLRQVPETWTSTEVFQSLLNCTRALAPFCTEVLISQPTQPGLLSQSHQWDQPGGRHEVGLVKRR